MKNVQWVSAFLAGIIFAIGLGVSGMTDTTKVIGFLALNQDWYPALMLVMDGAIIVHFVFFRFIIRRKSPLYNEVFHIPTQKEIDIRLLIGALLFGVGWGLGGVCPGPGLVSLASGSIDIIVFVVAMFTGMFSWQLVHSRLT